MSRTEVVVTFLALLELIRLKVLMATQSAEFDEIFVEAAPPQVDPMQPELPIMGPASHASPTPELPPADIVQPPDVLPPDEPPSAVPLANPPGPTQA